MVNGGKSGRHPTLRRKNGKSKMIADIQEYDILHAEIEEMAVDPYDRDERDRLIAAVAGTVVTHPITVDAIIGVIKAAGDLSDYGYGAERLIREKLLEYKRKEPAS